MCSCTSKVYKSVLIYSTLKPEGIKYDTIYADKMVKYHGISRQHQGLYVLMIGYLPDKEYIYSQYPMRVESLVITRK